MRNFPLATVAAISIGAALVAGSISLAAQEAEYIAPVKKVLGYQDPKTGAFKPLVKAEPDVTLSPTTGWMELTLTITLKTWLPKGGTIICNADLSTTSESLTTGSYSIWEQSSYKEATVSGTTATCTVYVPYSYLVPAASSTVTNTITGDYTVEMTNGSGTVPPVATLLTGSFLNAKLPATGTTTKVSLNVTI